MAHDVWLKLCNTYEGSSKIKSSRKDTYSSQYQTFSQKPGESLDNCFGRFESIMSSLCSCGPLAYSNNERAIKLMYALDDHVWGMKITALEESIDFATLDTENCLKSLNLMNCLGKVIRTMMLLLLVLMLVVMMLTRPTLSHLLWSLPCPLWLQLLMSSMRASPMMRSSCWQESSTSCTSFSRRGGGNPGAASGVATPPTSSPTAPRGRSSTPPISMTTPTGMTPATRMTIRRSTASKTRRRSSRRSCLERVLP
jgi:hypothetical protein